MNLGPISKKGAGVAIVVALLIIAGLIVGNRIHNKPPEQSRKEAKHHLLISGSDSGYVDSSACAGCHRQIWDSYRQTGMGRSWSRIRPDLAGAFNQDHTFYHPASDRYYKMYRAGGKYYQRRHQLDRYGQEVNAVESEIDYIVGSGNQ